MPFVEECGWTASILACDAGEHAGIVEPELVKTLPDHVHVVRARAIPLRATEWFGIRNETIRSLPALAMSGAAMLMRERFDLVFISTTMFPAFVLGRLWHALFRIPYVLDYQDPWVSDYKRESGVYATRKYALAQRIARVLEPLALRQVSGLTSVSQSYLSELRRRYPWLWGKESLFLPFGGSSHDFDVARKGLRGWKNPVFDPADGLVHWVYVGRGGDDMHVAVRALFGAFRERLKRDFSTFSRVRMHFIGTSYAASGKGVPTISPVAAECGVADFVLERPDRLPYMDTLRTLLSADGLVIPGSDDPSYTASKLYPYLLAGRPVLAIFNQESHVAKILKGLPGVRVCTFPDENEELSQKVCAVLPDLFDMNSELPTRPAIGLSSREAARQLFSFFDRLVSVPSQSHSRGFVTGGVE